MARRSDHTRDEIKEMAISAGQAIIINEGFNNFSARKVAREIGYTVGTLYNIFENYDDIILHINAITLDEMGVFILGNLGDDIDPDDAIKKLAESYLLFAQENYNRWSTLFEHNLPSEIEVPEWYSEKINSLFLLVENLFLKIFDNDSKQAARSAKTMWASIHGICLLGLSGKLDVVGAESVDILIDDLIENYMKGRRF